MLHKTVPTFFLIISYSFFIAIIRGVLKAHFAWKQLTVDYSQNIWIEQNCGQGFVCLLVAYISVIMKLLCLFGNKLWWTLHYYSFLKLLNGINIFVNCMHTPAKSFLCFEILVVATQLTTPVMGISYPVSFRKDCFDMLSSIGFGDLVRLFSSLCFSVLLSHNLGAFT